MNEFLLWLIALFAGALLGLFYFGGLWWTIRKGTHSRNPALLFLGSMIVRTGTVLAGFYFVSGGHWERILVCLTGFVAARIALLRLPAPTPETKTTEP